MNILGPVLFLLTLAAAPQIDAGGSGHSPRWVRTPSQADLNRNYPRGALEQGVSGHATMKCAVNSDGRLADCVLIEETPPDKGFGRATLALVSKFQMSDPAGIPAGVHVQIPVGWKIG